MSFNMLHFGINVYHTIECVANGASWASAASIFPITASTTVSRLDLLSGDRKRRLHAGKVSRRGNTHSVA